MTIEERRSALISRIEQVQDGEVLRILDIALTSILKAFKDESIVINQLQIGLQQIENGEGKTWNDIKSALQVGLEEGLLLRKTDGNEED